jgi:hypothetical protein
LRTLRADATAVSPALALHTRGRSRPGRRTRPSFCTPRAPALCLVPPNGRQQVSLNEPNRLQRRDLLGGLIHEHEAA